MAVDGLAPTGTTFIWEPSHGGAGPVVVEATAIALEGRITPGCPGIWSDEHAQPFVPAVKAIKAAGSVPGIQIAHAGRKTSANRPWEGDDHIPNSAPEGWQTIAPSPIAYGGNLPKVPREMTRDDIARVQKDFVDAARRARRWLRMDRASFRTRVPGTKLLLGTHQPAYRSLQGQF